MKFALICVVIAAFVFVYIYWVRPYLKTLPQFSEIWRTEETSWDAIKIWLDGRKTIFAGLWGEVVAFFPDLLQIVSGVDLKAALSLPDNWAIIIGGLLVPILMLIFRTKAKTE